MEAVSMSNISWKQVGKFAVGIVVAAVVIVATTYLISWAWKQGQKS